MRSILCPNSTKAQTHSYAINPIVPPAKANYKFKSGFLIYAMPNITHKDQQPSGETHICTRVCHISTNSPAPRFSSQESSPVKTCISADTYSIL
ncbi:hypothetical protein L208DRAFT_1408061 [Tricholoma matsutake]|nr:hypothetical protein L208DRAFT_1408061 [Tricholoma matsutake 945]